MVIGAIYSERCLGGLIVSVEPIHLDPDPLSPYCISPGFKANGMLYLSGHAAISESGELVGVGDFDTQAQATFESLQRTLQAGGSDLSKVIKVTIYLTDMSHFEKVVTLRQKWFSAPYPADTIVEVSALALPELMIEIEAIAAEG